MSSSTSLEQSAPEHPVVTAPALAQADRPVYQSLSFANHSQPAPEGAGVNRTSPGSAPLPHGYSQPQIPQSEAHIHPELRSSHEPPTAAAVYAPVPNMIQPGPGVPQPSQTVAMSGPPAVVAPAVGQSETGEAADGRKAKRELSQSKRAAQNRAAQRAFRQRKEGYIKKLEQQVRDYGEMEITFKALQAENYALRDYVLRLQSRLLDTQGDYPQPPPGVNLAHPNNPQAQPPPPPHGGPETATQPVPAAAGGPGSNPLEVAAQAVAGLNRSEHLGVGGGGAAARDPYAPVRAAAVDDDARTAEEITRQLQSDGAADGLPAAAAAARLNGLPTAPM